MLVVRTSGVLAAGGSRAKGGSFVDRILERARGGQRLRVVRDQVFAPTYAPDLAAAVLALAERGPTGLVHVVNAGACSWHELAEAALEIAGLRVPVEAITTAELARARPPSGLLGARHRPLPFPRPAAAAPLARGPGRDAPPVIPLRDDVRSRVRSRS